VVDAFGRFDVVEEALEDHGETEGGQRAQQLPGSLGLAAGYGLFPGPEPVGGPGLPGRCGQAAEYGQVQDGVSDPGVTPVEQDGRADPDPGVAGVGVAVDQDVGQAAGFRLSQPGRCLVGQPAQDRVAGGPAGHDLP
jgi:hypothetical protein